jgi:hypothetical protein
MVVAIDAGRYAVMGRGREVKRNLQNQLAGRQPEKTAEVTVAKTVELFVADKRIQGVSPDVLGKDERELKRLREHAEVHRVFALPELTREILIGYLKNWNRLYPSSNPPRW